MLTCKLKLNLLNLNKDVLNAGKKFNFVQFCNVQKSCKIPEVFTLVLRSFYSLVARAVACTKYKKSY